MGLSRNSGNRKYIRFKNGAFYLASDLKEQGDNAESYDTLEGQITSIGLKEDTYEGNVIEKLTLDIESDGETYNLSFPFDTIYCSNFISFLKNADVSQPVGLKAISKKDKRRDGEEYNRVSILVYQRDESDNEVYMKSYYTKENPNGMPEMKQVTVSGKTMWDKTDKLAFERKVVIDEIRPNLVGSTSSTSEPVPVEAGSDDVMEDDDLPF